MQLSVPWRIGQQKPFTSIPRINWAHPLTKNLAFYGYDIGSGPINLANSGIRNIRNAALITKKPSKFGAGIGYVAATSASRACAFTVPASAVMTTFDGAAGQWSIACGVNITAAPDANAFLYSIGDTATNVVMAIGIHNTAGFSYNWANGVPTTHAGTTSTLINRFHVACQVATSGTVGIDYLDGVQLGTVGSPTNVAAVTSVVSVGGFNGGTATTNSIAAGFIYFAAAWTRALTQSETLQLYVDPYCFLIYPEDDMFAELTSIAAAVTSPTWGWEPESAQKYIFAQQRRGAGGSPR